MHYLSKMTFSSLVTATVVFVGGITASTDVSATTLATFDIDGAFEYATAGDGSTFSIGGSVAGDASGAGDTSLVQPLIFSAAASGSLTAPFPIGPIDLFDGSTDPILTSLDDALFFATGLASFVLDELAFATGGVSDDIVGYLLSNTGIPFEFVPGYTIDFLFTGGVVGPTVAGTYDLAISSGDGVDTLDAVVSDFLGLDTATSLLLAGGFAGEFDASFEISTVAAVPLPASLPLLGVGAFAMFGLSRRRKQSA